MSSTAAVRPGVKKAARAGAADCAPPPTCAQGVLSEQACQQPFKRPPSSTAGISRKPKTSTLRIARLLQAAPALSHAWNLRPSQC